MQKSKKILVLTIIATTTLLICGCNKKEEEEQPTINYVDKTSTVAQEKLPEIVPIYFEYNKEIDIEKVLDSVSKETGLTSGDSLKEEDAKEIYNLNGLSNVETYVRKNDKNEIAIIKVPNTDKTVDVIKGISKRVQKLGINSSDESKIVIEQNEGIITVVICENARAISEKLKTEFLEKEEIENSEIQ